MQNQSRQGEWTINQVKITVLKTTLDKELAAEYGVEGLKACPMMTEGQMFYADYAKPDGLCDEAWKAIYQYVFALAHGAGQELFCYGDWIRKPGVDRGVAFTGADCQFTPGNRWLPAAPHQALLKSR